MIAVTVSNVVFETHSLASEELLEAVLKFGVKVEGILTKDFALTFDWNGERWRLDLPTGYAAAPSVPELVRSSMPATGAIRWGSYPHDWLYEFHSMSRRDADQLFLEANKVAGLGWYQRNKAWTIVRAAGWRPWNKHDGEMTLIGLTKIQEGNP